MNLKEIKEILDLVVEKGFTEFEFERSGVRLRLKREGRATPQIVQSHVASQGPVISYEPVAAALPPPPAAPPAAIAAPPAAASAENLHVIKSPIVGTFFESPSPTASPFVEAGSKVKVGAVLCIVEAMKLMNEIESDVAGVVVERLVANGQPVEYGQPLFRIRLS
jgi:acetyl-CoA carboxylase biotin carboxyl carrier protein